MKENAGKTKYVVLGMLARCPQSGYTIKKWLENEHSHFWQESYGQIYPTLKKLVAEGFAVCGETPQKENGRGQILYSITPTGRAELEAWLREPPDIEKLRYELLLKISFGEHTSPEVLLGHLDAFIRRNEKLKGDMDGYIAFFDKLQAQGTECTNSRLTALCGTYLYGALKDWAQEAKRIISEKGSVEP